MYAHEKNGFNKIVRACEKINKTRAKEEAKRVKDQTKADAKASAPAKAKASVKAKAPVKAKALVKPSSSLSFLVIHEEEDEPIHEVPLPVIHEEPPPVQAPTNQLLVQAAVFTQMVEDQRDQKVDHLAKYNKFKVIRNAKEPACKWKRPANHIKKAYHPSKFNTGIPTGPDNNLLVVDVDEKDEGIEEFQKYIEEHGDINTFKVQTPSGGYHLYFKYKSANADDNVLITSRLKTASKYRGKGIDIRSAGGYIVAPPSRRDGNNYSIINNTAPIDIPPSLISWLITGKPPVIKKQIGERTITREVDTEGYEYVLTDEQLKSIIDKLPANYLDNYSDWLIATSCLKCHDAYDIWSNWSKQSDNYNEAKNEFQWSSNRGFIDINYLVWLLRKDGHDVEYVSKYKTYDPITKDVSSIKQVSFNKPFVSEGLAYETFEAHDTIIIKSCTGTGKTTAVAQHANDS